ncbi:hypothetical protein WJX84_006613 [Apatococcus fuscideae]|uniref:Mannose-P-dolichol utilization defect 1 protein homolog n=1 Tax=Apatococcus fuscideae TaxID=2026836 RepID=A0AAW1TC49_9CHLO
MSPCLHSHCLPQSSRLCLEQNSRLHRRPHCLVQSSRPHYRNQRPSNFFLAPGRAQGHPAHWQTSRTNATGGIFTSSMAAASIPDTLAILTGYMILAGSCIRSVPQILLILRTKSAQGISLSANVAELAAYSVMISYNVNLKYPFSTYGEVVACWIQDIILIVLILKFSNVRDWRVWASTLLLSAGFYWMLTGSCGMQALIGLQAATIPLIALGGRVPQIVMNWKQGNAGQLSLLTTLMNVAGCIARTFTSIVLTQDMLNLTSCVVQGILNSILLYQILVPTKALASGKEESDSEDLHTARAPSPRL